MLANQTGRGRGLRANKSESLTIKKTKKQRIKKALPNEEILITESIEPKIDSSKELN